MTSEKQLDFQHIFTNQNVAGLAGPGLDCRSSGPGLGGKRAGPEKVGPLPSLVRTFVPHPRPTVKRWCSHSSYFLICYLGRQCRNKQLIDNWLQIPYHPHEKSVEPGAPKRQILRTEGHSINRDTCFIRTAVLLNVLNIRIFYCIVDIQICFVKKRTGFICTTEHIHDSMINV